MICGWCQKDVHLSFIKDGLCAECWNINELKRCQECGGWLVPGDGFGERMYLIEGVEVCEDCALGNHALIECECCRELHGMDDIVNVLEEGMVLCKGCFEGKDGKYCESCGEAVLSHSESADGKILCEVCSCKEYSNTQQQKDKCRPLRAALSKRNPIALPDPLFDIANRGLTVGFELELAGRESLPFMLHLKRKYPDKLYFHHDGSVPGIEVVTVPLSADWLMGPEGRRLIESICLASRVYGMKATSRCGFHIHVGIDYFGSEVERYIAKVRMTDFCKKRSVELYGISGRKDYGWTKRYAKIPEEESIENAISEGLGDRYRAINVSRKDTIEFRLFQACKNPDRLMGYIVFVVGLSRLVKNQPETLVEEAGWDELIKRIISAAKDQNQRPSGF